MNENYTGSNQAIPEGMAMRNMQSAHSVQMNSEQMKRQNTAPQGVYGQGMASIGNIDPRSEIALQVDNLENKLCKIELLIGQLNDTISPVLAGKVANAEKTFGVTAAIHSPLGGRLAELNGFAERLRESLEDIIGRCKL